MYVCVCLCVLTVPQMQEITEWIVSINAALQQARGIAYAQSKGTAVDPTLMSMFQADLGKQGWVRADESVLCVCVCRVLCV